MKEIQVKGDGARQTIYYGGTIRTMDEREQAEAVLVSGGRMPAGGNLGEVERKGDHR